MTVVKINAITVPDDGTDATTDAGAELERRFAARAGAVDKQPGFEGFELLRPTDGSNRYFVVTRWADEESFQGWVNSRAFGAEHGKQPAGQRPVSSHAELLAFEVVELSPPPTG
jgi:heme-degrading monooxygenase HmoA